MRYLVEVLWASRSALHASSDLYDLVFVRWERQRDWSPWNCILLSKEEATAHLEVEDVHEVSPPADTADRSKDGCQHLISALFHVNSAYSSVCSAQCDGYISHTGQNQQTC